MNHGMRSQVWNEKPEALFHLALRDAILLTHLSNPALSSISRFHLSPKQFPKRRARDYFLEHLNLNVYTKQRNESHSHLIMEHFFGISFFALSVIVNVLFLVLQADLGRCRGRLDRIHITPTTTVE